jgi:LuxR family transcriptional regulator, maltose regulon positive regulatory protein
MDGPPPNRRTTAAAGDPFLTIKITAPAVPDWVVTRKRIENQIAAGARGPLTVITGPPGAGKTVAMASWAATHSRAYPTAWVTLDEYDNRPRIFWPYLVEAFRHAGVSVPRRLSAAARGGSADPGFILRLAAAIEAHGSPVSLVLDDFHLVSGRSQITGLARLLRNAQPSLHVVLASRGDPGFPLHRYRLAGELTEIRAGDLAFTVAEAGLLMAQHDVTLPEHALEYLTERAEGWAAALRLAAMSMKHSPDPEQSAKEIASGDGAVASYLVDEVLNTHPPRVRNLLLKTSILDRVNPELAREVVGDHQAASELPALAEANAFVEPLPQGWYRYHSMFAEVLRLKLRREVRGQVTELRHRAAGWLQQHGQIAEAVRQAAEAGDWQFAARIVVDELAVDQLIRPEILDPLAEVLRDLPRGEAWPQPQPWLVVAALSLLGPGADASATALEAAQRLLDTLPDHEEIPSRLAAAQVRIALARRTGDLQAAAAAVADAVTLLGKLSPDLLERHPRVHQQVTAWQGMVEFWSGNFPRAAAIYRALAACAGSGYEQAACLGRLALLEAVNGRLSSAAALAADADEEFKNDLAADHPHRAGTVARAYVHLERHELPDARRRLHEAEAALRACPDKPTAAIASLVAARGCLAEGRSHEAVEIVARARDGWSPPGWLERDLLLTESRAFTLAGDTGAALAAARRAGPEGSPEGAAALARAWLAAGDAKAARVALAASDRVPEASPDHARVETRLVEAHIAACCGERARAVQSLERAFQLAEAEHLRLPFVFERGWLRPILDSDPGLARAHHRLLHSRPATGAHRSPDAGKPPASQPRAAVTAQAAPVVVESLTEREREVLRHVSQLLLTTEIASEMYVSVNTVKSHLKSIFRKLGAASRNEAVRRARQLELI